MSNIKKFNLTIDNLVNDIILVFPNYKYLQVFKEKFNLLITYNVRKPIEFFKDGVYSFKEQILSKNEEFFINKDYKDDVQQLQYDSKWSLDQVLNLKELWGELNDENKEVIWTYFSVLIKLVELEYNV